MTDNDYDDLNERITRLETEVLSDTKILVPVWLENGIWYSTGGPLTRAKLVRLWGCPVDSLANYKEQ